MYRYTDTFTDKYTDTEIHTYIHTYMCVHRNLNGIFLAVSMSSTRGNKQN